MRFFLTSLLLLIYVSVHTQDSKFVRISSEQGLSQVTVNCILQDSKGYMWFGTQNGLNRYDGYDIAVFRNNPSDTNSLSEDNIECLYEDRNGTIWIGTRGGLNAYTPSLNRFVRYQNDFNNPNSISSDVIKCIYQDRDGLYWIGTPYGLNSFDGRKNHFTKFQYETEDTLTMNGFKVEVIFEDRKGRLWVGTYDGGLNLFDREKKTFSCYLDTRTLAGAQTEFFNRITCVAEDEAGLFWVGTDNGGVAVFNPDTKKYLQRYIHSEDPAVTSVTDDRVSSLSFDDKRVLWIGTKDEGISCYNRIGNSFFQYRNNEYDLQSLSGNDINCIYTDRDGNVWVGTVEGGVSVYFPNSTKFKHLRRNVYNEQAFRSNTIMAILQSEDGQVWLGTKGGGITAINRSANTYTNYGDGGLLPGITAKNNGVLSFYEDPDGILWVGTWGRGVNKFDRKKNTCEYVIEQGAVLCIVPGSNDNLWLGFYGRGQGLYRYNRKTKDYVQYTKKNGLSSDDIYCVYEDAGQKVWVGTVGGGLNRIDLATGAIKSYQHQKNKNSISDNQVNCIYDDGKENLWVGTSIGLNKLNVRTEEFTTYYESDGLPSNYICGILGDKKGSLWISSNNGLTRFDPTAENTEGSAFKNFTTHDGLQDKEFNVGAYFQNRKTGEMFFGGLNGINTFYPDNITDNRHIPPVYITSFKKFGKEAVLDTSISDKKFIELSYKDNFISFEFVALDYLFPAKNMYSFIMEGLDNNWSPPSTRHYVSYTNLPGGNYVFRVKASNSDGVWNEEGVAIHLKVIPPWWKTNAFYTFCVLFSIAFLFAFIRFRTAKIEKEKKILEQKVEERTAELAQKNKDITSSIQYAKRIQDAILPTREQIQKHFPDSFVLFKPKDIVSGDFYWFGEKNGRKIAACVDCTGHGVPGAFMSMIGTNLLNHIILENGITEPASILSALNQGVKDALKQGTHTEIETTDGMDIALCSIDLARREVQFSSALRHLVVISQGKMEKVEGNKFPIGGAQLDRERIFTNHLKFLNKGDMLYMFSDGYADQFGGDKGKKFMIKKLYENLMAVNDLPLFEQRSRLDNALEEWKGKHSQVDDVLVIGIRI